MGKILNTRIQLRYDSYEKWQASIKPLYVGEIAICYIPANTSDFNNDQPLVMHKIGIDNTTCFKDLPWANAYAYRDYKGQTITSTYATKEELQAQAQEYLIVSTLKERDEIQDRLTGMRVYVIEVDALYTWNGLRWSQSLDSKELLLSYFDPIYFRTEEGKAFLSLNVDNKVKKGSSNLITSGAVFNHVEDTVGVIENALEKI